MIQSKLGATGESIFSIMTALAQSHDAINLAQGFPGFNPDPRIFEYTQAAMQAGENQYAPMRGMPALNAYLCQMLNEKYGTSLQPDQNLTVTAGATQAIFTAISALVHPEDEVIVFDPAYDCYKPAIQLTGGHVKSLSLDENFQIPWNELEDTLSDRSRLIIINTPHNPGGSLLTAADWDRVAELIHDKPTLVLSDEVYHEMTYDGHTHHSVLACSELKDRALAIYSFGKSFHITGWKVGYIAGAEALMREFQKVHQFNVFSVHRPSQVGLLHYMQHHPEVRKEISPFYQKKRDILLEAMEETPLHARPCHGSYFGLFDYSAYSQEPDVNFAHRLTREAGVATIPISVFYETPPDQQLIRICFAKETETLHKAADRLRDFFQS
jgi:methionine aminotransferase